MKTELRFLALPSTPALTDLEAERAAHDYEAFMRDRETSAVEGDPMRVGSRHQALRRFDFLVSLRDPNKTIYVDRLTADAGAEALTIGWQKLRGRMTFEEAMAEVVDGHRVQYLFEKRWVDFEYASHDSIDTAPWHLLQLARYPWRLAPERSI